MVIKQREDITLCYPFSEDRLFNRGRLRSRWFPPYLQQPKLNGERCRALVYNSQRCLLFSSTGELITTVPHINQQMLSFPPGEYDGELYVHGWSFSQIHSVISTVKSIHPRMSEMQFHIFDIVDENDPQHIRIKNLNHIFQDLYSFGENISSIIPVKNFLVDSLSQIMDNYTLFINNKYEGMILRELNRPYLRRRTPYIMKFKPREADTYKILSYNEAVSKEGIPLGMVGSFNCIDDMKTEFSVGAGHLNHKTRRLLWSQRHVPGSYLLVKYQTMSDSKGVPHFAVACDVLYNGRSLC